MATLWGRDLYRLKEIMRHADIDTTQKYAYFRPDALREEMNKCFGESASGTREPSKAKLEEEIKEFEAELEEKRNRLEELVAEE